ncbi:MULTISPECIES: acyl carrier protein [Campylobacter]|mgnify:FL=1|uniref:acyl carrier protein n=1 Tax=Campylobacter TaxID=194 RepID=UPI0014703C78|nr:MULTISPECIES: acyl carrier protein [Campylobacter]MBN7287370.1 acyl carrier protein [Campylobacter curvus]MDU6826718.1 acyl carrier protein [Campylobacter sp.]
MSQEEIFGILKKALVELFEMDESKIKPQTLIYEDLQIDSIDAIDLIDYIKRQTGYRLMPEDFKNVKTLDDIVKAVAKKFEAQDS